MLELWTLVSIFLAVALGGVLLGKKLWVDPAKAMDRVNAGVAAEEPPAHPSLVFQDLIVRIGKVVPASPANASVMTKRMIRAGIRNEKAVPILYGAKVAGTCLLALLAFLLTGSSEGDPTNRLLFLAASALAGFFLPNEWVKWMAAKRQKQIQRGLPNALDLMVVSVESGLGLDQAIIQVANELEHAYPAIAEEFLMVNLELKAGKRRMDALRNLGDRAAVEDLRRLVAVLIQADRFGTSIAYSLRTHAEYMRVQSRQIAEEKAAKLGVKLVFPIFFCILPSLFVVTVGPVAVRIVRDLLPTMNSV